MSNLNTSNTITMSSREIADLTGKEHKNVKRDIENMLSDLEEDALTFERIYFDSMNRQQTEYLLDRDHAECLVTGYNAALRMKVIKRIHELEERSKTQLPDFNNPAVAARAWADQVEQRQKLENQLAIAAPKVEFADRVGESEGVLIGNYAKVVKLGQNKLFAWLRDNGILIASGSRRNVPKQEYMDRGYFTVKETAVNTNHGIHISFTTKLTGKGQQWLTRKLVDNGLLKAMGDAA
ncbi:phage antirepressor KilAC domain-containing protein [Citrobacter koseri]|uniref:phage antirepressor KilAC domain-containing protein n=1 Tax=Citrobacter koseri TaxID=545 RepID=UPI001904DD23|nr:phage antirepressor KilAC domain-containing protein [Citrobacter koseri]MBJ8867703.1 phage antirepressor KilAC domain-containing protein [Citrobacter koseri]MBL4565677.1 phage antirepressor KilAC domain-containing protein [Citrobacter koseri]